MTKTPDSYAYGRDEVDCYVCPASAAGFEPSSDDITLFAAEKYDDVVREMFDLSENRGVISEEAAREAWLDMIPMLEEQAERHETFVEKNRAIAAKKVASELGWR